MTEPSKKIYPQIGLKLWAPNVGAYLDEAQRLYANNAFDYIELYSSPDSTSFIPAWEKLDIPFTIHCAHSLHDFNLSIPESQDNNRKLFSEAVEFFTKLKAQSIIVHPGIMGEPSETVRQLRLLTDEFGIEPKQILVENKPFINLLNQPCVGASPESMAQIKNESGTGTVLDVGHAIKYAIGAGRLWEAVLSHLMALTPEMLHISDASMGHPKDEHLHFGTGEFDFDTIFRICSAPLISIETVKDDPDRLDDFVRDVVFLKSKLAIGTDGSG